MNATLPSGLPKERPSVAVIEPFLVSRQFTKDMPLLVAVVRA